MPQMALAETHDLAIGYVAPRKPPRIVAEGINLTLNKGELICLIGPNGAGKSTLMRTLAGMQKPLAGRVLLDGADLHTMPAPQLAQRLSVVLTDRVDPGLLTGHALVALGRHPYTDWSGRLTAHDEAMVNWAIEAVGADVLAARMVGELSDGERQRLMIARALAQEPLLMILDEPTAFLDLPRRVEIMRLLRQIAHETGRAVLLSTHDLDLTLRTADRIWLLSADGQLYVGAPEDLVLNGAFESVFSSEGVTFDVQTGAFRVSTQVGVPIALIGEGLAALWTGRALERAGFAVTQPPTPQNTGLTVEIMQTDGLRWHLRHTDGTNHTYNTLYDLIAGLALLTPTSPAHRS